MRRIVFVVLLLCSSVVTAKTLYPDFTVTEVTSIYDADTFRVDVDGWPDIIGKRVPIRVLGVDAAEIRGKYQAEKKLARKAKQFTVAMLRNGEVIEVRNPQRGKYFRIVGDVFVDGESLAQALIKAGLARPYDGGKRRGWCE